MKKLLLFPVCLILLFSCGTTTPPPKTNDVKTDTATNNVSKPIIEKKTGVINTIVDGFDVEKVILWSNTGKDRYEVTSVTNKTKVTIFHETPDYYLVQPDNSELSGYCMKGFVKVN